MLAIRSIPVGRRLAWAGTAAWLAVAVWRLILAGSERNSEFGQARRLHPDLLLAQAVCATVAAIAVLSVADLLAKHDRRLAGFSLAVLAAAVATFFLMFLKSDLMAFGGVEN